MNRHYACSDLHGMLDLWKQISEYCDDTDTIYFLGDAADRGEDGMQIIRELLFDKRVKYIKGNHEDILINSFINNDYWLLVANGGYETKSDFLDMSDESQEYIIRRLNSLPQELEYTNSNGIRIVMNHSGYNPLQPFRPKRGESNQYLWDRSQYSRKWVGDDNQIIIHGHTPTPHLIQSLNDIAHITNKEYTIAKTKEEISILSYCDNHKINIDVASFYSGRAALVDLDSVTMDNVEVIYFKTEIQKEEEE